MVLQEYAAGIEARHRMLELVPPGNVILLRAIKVSCRDSSPAVVPELGDDITLPEAVQHCRSKTCGKRGTLCGSKFRSSQSRGNHTGGHPGVALHVE